jgi:hypothetical protein
VHGRRGRDKTYVLSTIDENLSVPEQLENEERAAGIWTSEERSVERVVCKSTCSDGNEPLDRVLLQPSQFNRASKYFVGCSVTGYSTQCDDCVLRQ